MDDTLQLIVFDAVGFSFGVDTVQVVEILQVEEANNRHINTIHLEDKVSVGARRIPYRSPKVLVVKEEETTGILVDEPKDIIDVNLNLIHPLPRLIALSIRESAIWGACFINETAIYLIDCYELLSSVNKRIN